MWETLTDHPEVLYGAVLALVIVVLLTPAVGGMARLLGVVDRREDGRRGAPRGVPRPIVDRLNTEFVTLYREAKFVEYLEKQAVLPAPGTPAEFLQFLKRDRQDAEFLIRISNQSREDYKPQQ